MHLIVLLFISVSCSTSMFKNEIRVVNKNEITAVGPLQSSDTIFLDKTLEYGLGNIEAENISTVDFDSDGNLDLVLLPELFSQPMFYRFDPKQKKFIKVASRLSKSVKASYLLFYDFNQDDVLDVLIGVNNQKLKLRPYPLNIYYGVKKKDGVWFEKGKAIFSKPLSSMSAIPLDFDRDGDLDIYVGNWYDFSNKTPNAQHDFLFENKGSKFINATAKLQNESRYIKERKLYPKATPTFSLSICDMNNDSEVDILTTSTHRYPNKLWINKEKSFKDLGVTSGYANDKDGLTLAKGGGRSFFSMCNDYNDDTLMDVFMGELTHNYDSSDIDRSSILRGKKFGETPYFWRTELINDARDNNWDQSDKRALWGDFNADGATDLFVENTGFPPNTRAQMYMQNVSGNFDDKSKESGVDIINPAQTIAIDINNDGVKDLISIQSNRRDVSIKRRLYVFENSSIPQKLLNFELVGNVGNRSAVGAKLMVKINRFSKIITKQFLLQQSFGSLPPQQDPKVSIPLLSEDEVLSVSVIWPSGSIKEKKYRGIVISGSKLQYLCMSKTRAQKSKQACIK